MSVVGARPQFVKLAPVSRALRRLHTEVVVHTGQHYDAEMSDVFWSELALPEPDYRLDSGSGSHAEQTSRMLVGIEAAIAKAQPDAVLVFGDTNSTLAGALAAVKVNVPVAHVEAGVRSFNRTMPEEINRVVTDRVSSWLFCPTGAALKNLEREGIVDGVSVVGDVMFDAVREFGDRVGLASPALAPLRLKAQGYLLATIHRAATTDSAAALAALFDSFAEIKESIVFPIHPRTRRAIGEARLTVSANVRVIDPVGYLDMLALEKHARIVLTDSGGVQKEAYFFGVPCLTLRSETEWTEIVDCGWNRVVGFDCALLLDAVRTWSPAGNRPPWYGDGDAATRIAEALAR